MEKDVLILGLSSKEALKLLVCGINESKAKHCWSLRNVVRVSVCLNSLTTLYPITLILFGVIQTIFLALASFWTEDNYLWIQTSLVAVLVLLNVCVCMGDVYLREVEIERRLDYVTACLKSHIDCGNSWVPQNYPHIQMPYSPRTIVLQKTVRDGVVVNVPWALLVKGDIIFMQNGQEVPAKCHMYLNDSYVLREGDIFKPETSKYIQVFVLDETPYLGVLQTVLHKLRVLTPKPASVVTRYAHLFFVVLSVHRLAIPSFILPISIRCFQCWLYHENDTFSSDWCNRTWQQKYSHIFVDTIEISFPLNALMFQFFWLFTNYAALARILSVFFRFRDRQHSILKDDTTFGDDDSLSIKLSDMENATISTSVGKVSLSKLCEYFLGSLFGNGRFLSRTENIVHTLGLVTSLCCTDKQGLLCWPNASPEKIFLLSPEAISESKFVDGASWPETDEEVSSTINVLTLTSHHHDPFKVEFDNVLWSSRFLSQLKALALCAHINNHMRPKAASKDEVVNYESNSALIDTKVN